MRNDSIFNNQNGIFSERKTIRQNNYISEIQIVVKGDPQIKVEDDVQCGGLVQKSDHLLIKILKVLFILPFIPFILVWKLLKCLIQSIKFLYQKILKECTNDIQQTQWAFVLVICKKIQVCCLKFGECIKQTYILVAKFFKKVYQVICESLHSIGKLLYDSVANCCSQFFSCLSTIWEKVSKFILEICKYPGKLLYMYADLAFRIFIKIAEIRMTIKNFISIISITFSLFIIAPIFRFLLSKILFPIFNKFHSIATLIINMIHIHIINQFYELFILNLYQILKCLYRVIIMNTLKLLKFVFFTIIYEKFMYKLWNTLKSHFSSQRNQKITQ